MNRNRQNYITFIGRQLMRFEVYNIGMAYPTEKILEFRGGLFNEAERKATTSEREFLGMANAATDRRYWTTNKHNVMFNLDHRALLAYTRDDVITPKTWRRMEGPLQGLNLEIQYRPGKEMLPDEFT